MKRPVSHLTRTFRSLAPKRHDGSCLFLDDDSRPRGRCWYHGGDWHEASAIAVRLVEEAYRIGIEPERVPGGFCDAVGDYVADALDAEGVDGWIYEAVTSPASGDGIQLVNDQAEPYYEGRHRTTALMQAGVRRTVIVRIAGIDLETGTVDDEGPAPFRIAPLARRMFRS